MKTERLKNSFFNSISNVLTLFTSTILSFILRTAFIKILGEQCLGIDGLFTNILSFLSLSELGISSVISFSLYKPLAERNKDKIDKLMSFYKNVYKKLAFLVLGFSLLLLPALKFIVKDYTVNYNIYFIYIFYVLDAVLSYFTSYKTILIEADQKNYLLTSIRIIFNFLTYGLQFAFLMATKNLYFYLAIKLIFRQIEKLVVNFYVSKKYPDVNFNCKKKVDKEDLKTIKENVNGILFHKLGNYAVNGTDNILISSIVNISAAGLYTNYLSLISIIKNFINGIITSATSSFGNLSVTDTIETKYNIFNIMNLVGFFSAGLFSLGIFHLINHFITIWVGNSYTLNVFCVFFISLNFYLMVLLQPVDTVKNSTGLYFKDRYVPILQAVINLVLSFILGKIYGLVGILASTAISYLLTVSWTKPYMIYKYVFNKNILFYLKQNLKNIVILLLSNGLIVLAFSLVSFKNLLLLFLVKGILVVMIFTSIFLLFNFKTKEFKFLYNLMKKQ